MVTLQLRQLVVQPGQRLQVHDVGWPELLQILASPHHELGDQRACRIAYSDGVLEIRMPSAQHEKAKVLIGDMVKIFLEELDMDNECFGSSTFKRQEIAKGIEPDDCFYIEHQAQMIGRDRIDLNFDPPPDLAIEVDVTSKTGLDAYQVLGVPELWRFEEGQLKISVLQQGQYQDVRVSPHFPEFAIAETMTQFIELSQTKGRSQTLKLFRQSVREHI
ncbi:MAG: Uma2 family endonuclease [Aphanocapsa sp. GSE-SYN-MK-11-07L]|jgi:Uma2 family endonuclease|nr:Uma2 family endonuclease [Aphanocapsa sp. GSE-SYN-MK-11-07L]